MNTRVPAITTGLSVGAEPQLELAGPLEQQTPTRLDWDEG